MEIVGGAYISENVARTSPTHRIWYAFHPADETPKEKPLAVFFNGGPGSSTTFLFAFNTGYWTLDPEVTGSEPLARNPHSWTRFVNTLYIDAPGTGFSYALPAPDGSTPSVGIDLDYDAGVFLRTVVRFLERHPTIQKNPVLLVGESYGGTRATLMLTHVLNYERLASDTFRYRDAALLAELTQHFGAVFPDQGAGPWSPEIVASQFSHQVLIQPVVAGSAQWNLNSPDRSVCRQPSHDNYQCDEPSAWSDDALALVTGRLTQVAVLEQALGVDPTTIEWMYASQRTNAYGKSDGDVAPAPELSTVFGSLGSGDRYYVTHNQSVISYYPGGRNWRDPYIGFDFLGNLNHVRTFITDARLDMVVWTPAIPPAFNAYVGWVESSVHDLLPRPDVARPGWIDISFKEAAFGAATTREIRFPHYPTAGHSVPMRQPAELLEDVMTWYAEPPAQPRVIAAKTPRSTATRSPASPNALEIRGVPQTPHVPSFASDYIGP